MKKLLSVILSLAMVLALFPAVTLSASAADRIRYDGYILDYEPIDADHMPTTWEDDTWYVASGVVTIEDRVECSGDVYLILKDDCDLTCDSGIEVGASDSLTIYAESSGDRMGSLYAYSYDSDAAIGGGACTDAGSVTICGGNIYATGSFGGAGIGGGGCDVSVCLKEDESIDYSGGNGGDVTIYDGIVMASGMGGGAGIGGGGVCDPDGISEEVDTVFSGGNGGNVTICGGTVRTLGSEGGAGIGGGNGIIEIADGKVFYSGGNGGDVTVYGGMVTPIGMQGGACIGGGYGGNGGSFAIYDGFILLNYTPGFNMSIGGGTCIGGGYGGNGGSVMLYGGGINALGLEIGTIFGNGFMGQSKGTIGIGPDRSVKISYFDGHSEVLSSSEDPQLLEDTLCELINCAIEITREGTDVFVVTQPFTDVAFGTYYFSAVNWAVQNGITNGTSETTFSPDAPVTRGQVVSFLWRAAGEPKPAFDGYDFVDVSADAYYSTAVQWAVEQGITKGTSATTFSPDKVCTRAEIVTFLARFAGVKDGETESVFSDVKADDYFAAAVKWAKDNGVTEGTSETTFGPDGICTRAQAVTFLWRWMSK